jgi:hypothetical protein
MKPRIYLAGPMSELPDFNYPAFNAAAARLRAQGLLVENPAENLPPPCGTWQGYMRNAITQLMRCDAVLMLPGWGDSRGAKLEYQLASCLGMPVSFLDGQGVIHH